MLSVLFKFSRLLKEQLGFGPVRDFRGIGRHQEPPYSTLDKYMPWAHPFSGGQPIHEVKL